jgi:DNA (cytosine-5)-methyltransferase 1
MIENVKALIQKKFIDDFYDIINELKEMGYRCYYPTKEDKKLGQIPTCLNAKNYGIAQNRERIFVICVRNDLDEELLEFPKGFDNGLRLKDFLEDEVDEKYYLSQEIQDRFKLNGTEDKNHNELNVIGSSAPSFRTIGQRDMTYGTNGIMSTLTATDYKQPKQILDKSNNELSFLGGINDKDWIGDGKSLSRNFPQGNRVYDSKGIACSQTAQGGGIGSYTGLYKEDCNLRIRKLTPLECWRLMGFRDECFDKAKELGLSDSALYKQAGNSIVVNVLYYIFKELFKDYIVK